MARYLSITEWVRQALKLAHRREPLGSVGKKLEIIRAAARHEFPTSGIEGMLAEIEAGHATSSNGHS